MNYEKDMRIAEDQLDVEWLEQPSLMLRYVQHATLMRKKLDNAKENLDVAKAELDRDIRLNPSKYGIEKITETVVQNTILSTKEYLAANKKVIETKYEAEMARAAVQAVEQRKEALENLVRLFGQQYFAGPRMPRNLSEERERKQKQVDGKIAQKMQRSRAE